MVAGKALKVPWSKGADLLDLPQHTILRRVVAYWKTLDLCWREFLIMGDINFDYKRWNHPDNNPRELVNPLKLLQSDQLVN